MATSVNFSRFFAALAAVLTFTLTACGGGEEMVSQETHDQAARRAFTGQVIANPQALDLSHVKPQKRAMAAPVAALSQNGFRAVFTAENLNQQTARKVSASAAATLPTGITPDELMDWAEQVFPTLFPSHQITASATLDGDGDKEMETYAFRRWPETDNHVGVRTDGKDVKGVYLYGPFTNYQIMRYAHIDDRAIKCRVNVEVVGCQPQVTSVTPADGATGVELKNVAIKAVFDQRLACPEAPITGTFGIITGTLTCANGVADATVTIRATTLPDNSLITASLSGFLSEDLIAAMIPETWSFATRKGVVVVLETKVLSVNLAAWSGGTTESASIIDPIVNTVKRVKLAAVPGYLFPSQVTVDQKNGVSYVGAEYGTYVLHRFDVKTGLALPAYRIDAETDQAQGIHGIAVTDSSAVYIVTGRWGAQTTSRGKLIGWNADGARIFTSPTDFVAGPDQTPVKILYSKVRNKFYVLAAANSGLIEDTISGSFFGLRDGYAAGTVSTLIEIDATTHEKGRTWNNIGSMTLDMAFVENEAKLLIVASGDRKLKTVDLGSSGTVTSVDWSALFGQYSYPTNILPDEEKGVYYVSDWYDSVRVMSLSTHQQVGRIVISGSTPRGLTIANGDLWVAAPRESVWYTGGQKTYVIDRNTRTIKRSIVTGDEPWNLVTYQRTEVQ